MFFNNYTKPGRGISKEELNKKGILLFFDILYRRIWKLVTLNLLYILVSIPAVIISLVISFYFLTLTASLKGINVAEKGFSFAVLSVLSGIVLFQLTGSGPATAAKCYVLRKFVNDKHSWVASDFFESLKKNFKQGMVVYAINTVLISILLFATIFYTLLIENKVLSAFSLVALAIFSMMQLYVYQLVAGVELAMKYIYKNSLALTIIKLPWNALVSVVSFAFVCLVYYLASTTLAICVAFIISIYFSIVGFTRMFMTNNAMCKYIIEPGIEKTKSQN